MEREVRYCTTEDGVRIAYSVEGAGQTLVMTPAFVESFSLHDLLAGKRVDMPPQLSPFAQAPVEKERAEQETLL